MRQEKREDKMLKWTVKKRLASEDNDDVYKGGDAIRVRKIHSRRSMGDALSDSHRKINGNSGKRRRSLNDKENTPVRSRRSVVSRQSSTPLNDSSNFHSKPCKRKHHVISSTSTSPLMSPISLAKDIFNFKEPSTVTIFQPLNYAPTLPSFGIEYSPLHHHHHHHNNNNNNPIMSRQAESNNSLTLSEDQLLIPSKKIKFDTLDMSYEFKPESASTSSPLSTPLTVRKKIPLTPSAAASEISSSSVSSLSPSLNSSEVGDMTLQQMIDDILKSARKGKKFNQCFAKNRDRNSNFVKPLSVVCETNMEQKSIERLLSASKIAQAAERTLIIASDETSKNEREVKSPVRDEVLIDDATKTEDVCQLKRQNAVRRKNTSNENKNRKKLNESQKTDNNQDSTIQKCLSFSSANYDDISEKMKRSSVASEASTSSSSYVSQSKFTKNLLMKGSLELATTCDEHKRKISIHGECGKVFVLSSTIKSIWRDFRTIPLIDFLSFHSEKMQEPAEND